MVSDLAGPSGYIFEDQSEGAMSTGFGAPAALDDQTQLVLDLLEQGRAPAEVETTHVDIKEEPGRRDQRGKPLPANREN